jgi:hypothetical protein
VPGLLQTGNYARAVIRAGLPAASRDQVERRVQVRTERRAVLRGDRPLELWGIVDEAAPRRQAGGRDVMCRSFAFMQFTDAAIPDVVYIDTLAGELFLEEDSDVRRYKIVFEHLRAVTECANASRSLMADLVSQI